MNATSRPARAQINLDALQHNLDIARSQAGTARVIAVIKADAYGHGMLKIAHALLQADAFAVACIGEALSLRAAGISHPILVLQGAQHPDDFNTAQQQQLILTLHSKDQLKYLGKREKEWPELWLKLDTGMGRLGFDPGQARTLQQRIKQHCSVLMTHFANADLPTHPGNKEQLACFSAALKHHPLPASAANSAALLTQPDSLFQWVRPGIMLYGASPLLNQSATALGLQAVMTLSAPLVTINQRRKGQKVGYGSSFECPEDMPIGIVAIGYGDGYPRHAQPGTPILIRGKRCPLVGRVSMDMLTVDLRPLANVQTGDQATLWGEDLPVDLIAESANTIAYELLCAAGAHCTRQYVSSAQEKSSPIERIN